MTEYKFIVSGQCKVDGNLYSSECIAKGMSKYELEEFIKEQNFKKETIKVKKEKIK